MARSQAPTFGFYRSGAPVASSRLLRAVAVSLIFAAGLCAALTVVSIKVATALTAFG